jgi:ketosteroid isomerase-like protein
MSEGDDAASAVAALVEAVNNGEFSAAVSGFAEDAVIIEDLPPFRWAGGSAASQWMAAMGANAARLGWNSLLMDIGEPSRAETEDDRAYVIIPGILRATRDGRNLQAEGTLTCTLAKQSGRWLIDTLVWSGPGAL